MLASLTNILSPHFQIRGAALGRKYKHLMHFIEEPSLPRLKNLAAIWNEGMHTILKWYTP